MKVANIITGLNTGGAEILLFNIIQRLDREIFQTSVISLTDIGPVGRKIEALNVPVWGLGMRRGVPNPLAVLRLASLLRQDPPDVVQTWMYHSDLIGGLAAKLAGGIPLVWSIHGSNFDPKSSKKTTIATAKISAIFSQWLPDNIICTSHTAQVTHSKMGYAIDKIHVILNGVDPQTFRPDEEARLSVRSELGLSSEALLVGLVARFDPQKDHRNFVQAAGKLLNDVSGVHFLLSGDGITWDNSELAGLIESQRIRDHFHLLGRRDDMPRIQSSLDIACSSSSYGETSPLAIAEAMACGVPCVVTNVGDSAVMVKNTGMVVAPRDSTQLANAWKDLLGLPVESRRKMGDKARLRILENFDINRVVTNYTELWCKIAK